MDPDPLQFPAAIKQHHNPFFTFNKAIIDATHDIACCYKPQIAHYAAQGREHELLMTIDYIKSLGMPTLLDAKRGDVAPTAAMYAMELFERYGADAITINPFLGMDSMAPFLDHADKGVFILCRTSNPGSSELQNMVFSNGLRLYEHIAKLAVEKWNYNGNVGLVVGATWPEELKKIRQLTGNTTFLVPGVGSQGASIKAMMRAGSGGGMLVNASRSIIFANNEDFAAAARQKAIMTRDELNQYRTTSGTTLIPTLN